MDELHIEKYKILGEIGSGGMATVYLGIDERLGRKVAIKLLHKHLMRNDEARMRFAREATTVAGLSHPNIVQIYDYSEAGESEQQYIVMEYVDGFTLGNFLLQHKIRFSEIVAAIGREIALALGAAHENGIVHRDLKPDNILINRNDGRLKLSDFGIARVMHATKLTQTTAVMGSPAYMSPEIIEGAQVDHRADIFSLGIVLYEMSTGKLPFDGNNPHALLKAIYEADYPNPESINPLIAPEFTELLGMCLKRDRNERIQSANEVAERLDAICERYGISHPEQIAMQFFLEPEKTEEQYAKTLESILEGYAKEAFEAEDSAAAIQHCNRLFEINPKNKVASEITNAIMNIDEEPQQPSEEDEQKAGSKFKPAHLYAAILLIIIAAIVAGVAIFWPSQPERDTTAHRTNNSPGLQTKLQPAKMSSTKHTNPSIKPSTQPQEPQPARQQTPQANSEQKDAAVFVEPKPRKKIESLRTRSKTAKKKTTKKKQQTAKVAPTKEQPPQPPKKGSLRIHAFPWANVFIDGKFAGRVPSRNDFELPEGEHEITLVNPFCNSVRRIVKILPNKEIEIRHRLRPLPAYLGIQAEDGAKIFVDGTFRGVAPLSKQLKIDWNSKDLRGGQSVRKLVEVWAEKDGKRISKKVWVERGKWLRIDLRPKRN